jgi:RNA polymerase sigma-70 factor, ECF subfamily
MLRRAPGVKVAGIEPDERLLIEAAQRDPSHFAELYENSFERVYAYVARRVRDRDAAEDLTAEVFQRALASLGRYQWRGVPFAAWLFRIAANAIADHAQRTTKEREITHFDDPEEISLEEVEYRAQLFRLVHTLPESQRRVLVMRFAEQRSIRDIALTLQRTEGAVKQLQWRGLQSLRERIGKSHG